MLSVAQRAEAVQDEKDLARMNELLAEVGIIADRLTYKGYEVMMTLWHADRGSHTIDGRLQRNVARVRLRDRETG